MSTLSTAQTVLPSDSASQVADVKNASAPTNSKNQGKRRGPKNAVDKAAPPGAVEVAAPGKNNTGKATNVVKTTIPITGWGTIDLSSHRKDIRPRFTVDAAPYIDLCETVYLNIQSRFSSQGKHIPHSLFMYYCVQAWWLRVLFLHKANANVLDSTEKDAFNVMSSGEEFQLPAPIAQYLANLGNFMQGGETFYFEKLPYIFKGEWKKGPVVKGWLPSADGAITVNTTEMYWAYAHYPSPGVVALDICFEANNISNNAEEDHGLGHISPAAIGEGSVAPTRNILGYNINPFTATHSSWRSTLSLLGWSHDQVPSDIQTTFNFSASTMKWVSEKLATITGLKLHSSSQLVLSVQGNPIQAYWLDNEDPLSRKSVFTSPDSLEEGGLRSRWKATHHMDFQLLSRYGMDQSMLSPSFSFGYRLRRDYNCAKIVKGSAEFDNTSNFAPWVFFNKSKAQSPVPETYRANMNRTFDFGSAGYINTGRFGTHQLNRSVGLETAVVLVSS